MKLKDFEKYLGGKSINELLHRARKESLSRILASEEEIKTVRKQLPPKRAVKAR